VEQAKKKQQNEEPVSSAGQSCGNGGGLVETVESQSRLPTSSHSSLEISPKADEIPPFPQLRRRGGKVENQKQVSHFPPTVCMVQQRKKKARRLGYASRLLANRRRSED